MTTLASKPRSMHSTSPGVAATVGGIVVSWPCTRRSRNARTEGRLERISCVLSVQPLDAQHAAIECWIESGGVRLKTILQSTTRPCSINADAAMTHIDATAANGTRLLALSINHADQRIVYAQSMLLREAGFGGGAYDPPLLRAMTEDRIAQSA